MRILDSSILTPSTMTSSPVACTCMIESVYNECDPVILSVKIISGTLQIGTRLKLADTFVGIVHQIRVPCRAPPRGAPPPTVSLLSVSEGRILIKLVNEAERVRITYEAIDQLLIGIAP